MARSIPRKDDEFDARLTALVKWVLENMERTGMNVTWIRTVFMPLYERWKKCYGRYINPLTRTRKAVINKIEARKAVTVVYSELVAMIKSNPMITDTERLSVDISIQRGGGHHASAEPDTHPYLEVVLSPDTPGRLVIKFRYLKADRWGKPAHVNHLELVYDVLPQDPRDQSDLKQRAIDTKTPLILDFPVEMSGLFAYLSGRWVSNTGKVGRWCPIIRVVIP